MLLSISLPDHSDMFLIAAYILVGCLVAAGIFAYSVSIDRSPPTDLSIPTNLDPFQIAYLRGGVNEMIRLATMELFASNLLVEKQIGWGKVLEWSKNDEPKIREQIVSPKLSSFAKDLLGFYRVPRAPYEVYRKLSVLHWEKFSAPWDKWIEENHLRIPASGQVILTAISYASTILYVVAGMTFLYLKILHHSDVVWISIIVAAIVGAAVFLTFGRPRRFSLRGKRFIEQLQFAYADHLSLNTEKFYQPSTVTPTDAMISAPTTKPPRINRVFPDGQFDANQVAYLMTSMGIFGVSALEFTPFSILCKRFQRSLNTSGGCGSSCAGTSGLSCSSSDSGGGDGGACCGSGCGSGGGGGCGSGCGGGCGGGGCGS